MKRFLLIFLLVVIAILAAFQPQLSCRGVAPTSPVPHPPQPAPTGRPQEGLPMVTMQLGGKTFTLEVARMDLSREIGLMFRDAMPANHGMIFVFPEASRLSFWMRNTRIPLDIVYVGADQRIVSVHQMKPYDESQTSAAGPAKWAIELNEGTAAKLGLKAGQKLDIPAEALQAVE